MKIIQDKIENKQQMATSLNNQTSAFIGQKIYPEHPTGLEPPPRNITPTQLKQPLIMENPHNENTDFKNWYNPDRGNNPTAYT